MKNYIEKVCFNLILVAQVKPKEFWDLLKNKIKCITNAITLTCTLFIFI